MKVELTEILLNLVFLTTEIQYINKYKCAYTKYKNLFLLTLKMKKSVLDGIYSTIPDKH